MSSRKCATYGELTVKLTCRKVERAYDFQEEGGLRSTLTAGRRWPPRARPSATRQCWASPRSPRPRRLAPRPWKPDVESRSRRSVGMTVAATTIAESGRIRPGVTSRSAAMRLGEARAQSVPKDVLHQPSSVRPYCRAFPRAIARGLLVGDVFLTLGALRIGGANPAVYHRS